MTPRELTCPSCGDRKATLVGPLPATTGLLELREPGSLYECNTCGLFFRHPYPSEDQLSAAYAEVSSDTWCYSRERADYKSATQMILKYCRGGNILDVGCFRGDFLADLPSAYGRYGVEPSASARARARAVGVTLIGHTIDDMTCGDIRFDAITMLDVIEHLPRPMKALTTMASLLKPRGVLILATGNRNALPWRIMRRDYWYYFPEHVSFLSAEWFRWASRQLEVDIVNLSRFSHFEGSVAIRMRQLAQAMAYRLTGWNKANHPSLHLWMMRQRRLKRFVDWPTPPRTSSWRDHIIVTIRKHDSLKALS